MSILVVEALSEGLIFGADRNITTIYEEEIGDVRENATLRARLRPFILHK